MQSYLADKVNDSNYHELVKRLVTTDTKSEKKGTNLQNVASKGDGLRVRNTFKPRDEWVFLGADLSQIEPRIMAHIMYERYGDNSLRQIFVDGKDLYTTMAMLVFNLDEKYCVDKAYDPTGRFKPRAMMKTGVLAKSYDQKAENFASNMGVTMDVAHMFYKKFDDAFPSFSTMVRDIRQGMKDNGYVETLYGRKRRFPFYTTTAKRAKRNENTLMQYYIERKRIRTKKEKDREDYARLDQLEELIAPLAEDRNLVSYWERASFNAVIQGTGADVLKLNMISLARVCKERGWELNASIHDEVKISVPKSDLTPEACDIVTECMVNSVTLSLPLKSDTVIEPKWMQEYDPDEWDFDACRPYIEKYDQKGMIDGYYEKLAEYKAIHGIQ